MPMQGGIWDLLLKQKYTCGSVLASWDALLGVEGGRIVDKKAVSGRPLGVLGIAPSLCGSLSKPKHLMNNPYMM